MIRDLPLPGKRPFTKNLEPAHLRHFLHHDDRGVWYRPFLHDGAVIAGNGTLTLRLEGFIDTTGMEEATADQVEAYNRKPMTLPERDNRGDWRALDDITGTLFKFHPKPIHFRTAKRLHFERGPAVWIGRATVAQLATLQLLARLPRCEVYTKAEASSPLYYRFNGGYGSVLPMPFLDPPKFHLFRPTDGPLKSSGKTF